MTDSWVQWLLTAGLAVASGWNGILQLQISSLKKDAGAANRDLWQAHNGLRDEYQAFRGDTLQQMVTKQDLQMTEQRILAALQLARGHGD